MRKISIEYHPVIDETENFEFPQDHLKILYWSAGIDLQIYKGERIERYISKQWDTILLKKWQDRRDTVGHLILGTKAKDEDVKRLPGQLVDIEHRGIAILFLGDQYFDKDKYSRILQSASHEIGHMLNLGHNSDNSFISVMDPSDIRIKDEKGINNAWKLAINEAKDKATNGEEPYFNWPASLPPCYPFNYSEREKLNKLDESELQPWLSGYNYVELEAHE